MTIDELNEMVISMPKPKQIKLSAHPDTDCKSFFQKQGFKLQPNLSVLLTGIPIEPNPWIPVGFLRVEIEGQAVKLINVQSTSENVPTE